MESLDSGCDREIKFIAGRLVRAVGLYGLHSLMTVSVS